MTRLRMRDQRMNLLSACLASTTLGDWLVSCRPHSTDHGSDHQGISTSFDSQPKIVALLPRCNFCSVNWKHIGEKIAGGFARQQVTQPLSNTQEALDKLSGVISSIIETQVPLLKPSPYAKRWWTKDLTRLRYTFTKQRNQVRRYRRNHCGTDRQLEEQCNKAKKEYFSAIKKQKRTHWSKFLRKTDNI